MSDNTGEKYYGAYVSRLAVLCKITVQMVS